MQGYKMGAKLRYRLTLVSGMLECLCFAGVLFGFTSLMFVLKEDGYFSQLCVTVPGTNSSLNSTDCSRQDEQFSLVFTIASFLNNFLNLFNGYLFDRYGTMVTRLLAMSKVFKRLKEADPIALYFNKNDVSADASHSKCLYTTGTLLVAFSTPAFSELLFPALSCITEGGILFLLTNVQVGNLFAARRSTVINLYNGAFDSSSAVFLIIKVTYQQGVSLRTSFLVLSVCSIIHLLRTFLLMPRTHIPYPLPQNFTYGVSCRQGNTYNVDQSETTRDVVAESKESIETDKMPSAAEDGTETQGSEEVQSFRSCVLSWFFLWHVLWLSIMQLRHYLFIGTLNPRLIWLANDDTVLVSQYTNAFAITQLFGVLCAPWNGLIMDRHKGKPLAAGETEREADLRSSFLSLFLTAVQCLLFSICASVPFLPLQYLTFALQVINRSFLYGGNAAFISIAFPACHFGKLYGLVMSIGAVVSLLQYPLFSLVKGPLDGDPLIVDITLTLLTLLVFIHPVYVFYYCRKVARHRKDRGPAKKMTETTF